MGSRHVKSGETTNLLLNRDYKVVPIMWFIDDSLTKNRKYYSDEMQKMAVDYDCEPYLFYGEQMFAEKGGIADFPIAMWNEIVDYLERWKKDLPDMPEINFDKNAKIVFDEIKDLPTNIFRKLFDNQDVIEQIFPIIFPERKVLRFLQEYFSQKSNVQIYRTLAQQIDRIKKKDLYSFSLDDYLTAAENEIVYERLK